MLHLLCLVSSLLTLSFVSSFSPPQSPFMSPPFARNVLEDATALPRRGLFSISKVTDHKPDKKAPAKSKNDPLKRFERASTAVTRSDKPIVVTIEGKRVELTDWAKAHPGGVKILERFHGKDATAAFHSVRHSPHAYALLELLASVSDDGSAQAAVASARARSGFLAQLRCKLFSKEDPIGVHKYLGLFCLLHFVFRYYQMLLGDPSAGLGSRLGQGPSWIAPFCLVPHAALSLSSLIFHSVPRERVVGKPMIWQEYRIHNIAFAMRSVMTALFGHLSIRHGHAPAWRHVAVSASCAIVLATNVVVDAATACLRADEAESTTATMPYWEGCSIRTQKRFKTFYAYCQFMATLVCLAATNPALPLAVLMPIQVASLLLTLVRKGIIGARGLHYAYTFTLLMPYFVAFRSFLYTQRPEFLGLFGLGLALFLLRRRGVNKYHIWVPVMLARIGVGDNFLTYDAW